MPKLSGRLRYCFVLFLDLVCGADLSYHTVHCLPSVFFYVSPKPLVFVSLIFESITGAGCTKDE